MALATEHVAINLIGSLPVLIIHNGYQCSGRQLAEEIVECWDTLHYNMGQMSLEQHAEYRRQYAQLAELIDTIDQQQ